MSRALLAQATGAVDEILRDVVELVKVETSSYDKPALDRGVAHLHELLARRLGEPSELHRHDGGERGDVLTATYDGTGDGHVCVVDRSARGVALTERACATEIASGQLSVRCVAAEDLTLLTDDAKIRGYEVASIAARSAS